MTLDFTHLDTGEAPSLVLKNLDGGAIAPLGTAFNIKLSLCYNEVSELSFDLPAEVDGAPTPRYDQVVGMRIVDVVGYGQFILVSPSVTSDGIREVKACRAYSLEYELTYKKIYLENSTYNFWNPLSAEGTVLSFVMELLPSWSLGSVDSDLVGRHRTFEVNDETVYHFLKNELQQTYGCIFEFDTYSRTIHVRSVSNMDAASPVYVSLDNLIKDIQVTEDTENIFTCLDINGADGVDIRAVNPAGTNKLYNFDYFMDETYFPIRVIDAWDNWKARFAAAQDLFYGLSVQQSLQLSLQVSEQAALADLQGELTALENVQSVIAQGIATGAKSDSDMADINGQIRDKRAEIEAKEALIAGIGSQIDDLLDRMAQITRDIDLKSAFDPEDWLVLDRYIKEDAIVDSTFVASTAAYNEPDETGFVSGCALTFENAVVTQLSASPYAPDPDSEIYRVSAGDLSSTGLADEYLAEVVSATLERQSDGSFILTATLSTGALGEGAFPRGNLLLTGGGCTVTSDCAPDPDAPDALATGTRLTLALADGEEANHCFTRGVTEYERQAISWELFAYGRDLIGRLSWPAYSFSVSAANFLALEDFLAFKQKLRFGRRIYLQFQDGNVLTPILTRVELDFESPERAAFSFGDRYSLSDSTFQLADLLDQSVSLGKQVDFAKYNYSSFVNSGASNSVRDFMNSALDVGKNAILSSTNQAITWDDAGLRLRRYTDEGRTAFEDNQIWMSNNSIMFTTDSWETAVMGIGEFKDTYVSGDTGTGTCYGIVAPNIVGTLLAGENLIIESDKQDGGTALFRVDENGCFLYNASFELLRNNRQILINPDIGIAIGKYPLYKNGQLDTDPNGTVTLWLDQDGNIRAKGVIQALDFLDQHGNSMLNALDQITGDYLDLRKVEVFDNEGNRTFYVDGDTGDVTMQGTLTSGVVDSSVINGSRINGGVISGANMRILGLNDKGLQMYSENLEAIEAAEEAGNLDDYLVGAIQFDDKGSDNDNSTKYRMWIYTENPYGLKLQGATGISLQGGTEEDPKQVHIKNINAWGDHHIGGSVDFTGNVLFSGTCTGVTAEFA